VLHSAWAFLGKSVTPCVLHTSTGMRNIINTFIFMVSRRVCFELIIRITIRARSSLAVGISTCKPIKL